MRRLLVDHARARGAANAAPAMTVSLERTSTRRADGEHRRTCSPSMRRSRSSPRSTRGRRRLVELRFFGGLTVDEAAAVLDVAAITVKRDWALARTWLYRELGDRS